MKLKHFSNNTRARIVFYTETHRKVASIVFYDLNPSNKMNKITVI